MATLASMISALEPVASGGFVLSQEDARDILKALQFLAKWEKEIRTHVPIWRVARDDPAVSAIIEQFPDATIEIIGDDT